MSISEVVCERGFFLMAIIACCRHWDNGLAEVVETELLDGWNQDGPVGGGERCTQHASVCKVGLFVQCCEKDGVALDMKVGDIIGT